MVQTITTGKLNPNALERVMEVEPLGGLRAKNALLRLDFLLKFFKENHENRLESLVKHLRNRFQKLITTSYVNDQILENFDEKFDMLELYPDLAASILNYRIQALDIGEKWNEKKIEVPQKNQLRAFLLPTYRINEGLIELLGREEAIPFIKYYLTSYIQSRKPETTNFVNLETTYQKATDPANSDNEWVIVRGMLSPAKYFYMNKNCMWVDALEDLPDAEIKYLTCCYGDYELAKIFNHDAIVLTMEHTIAQGDPYCSRVMHDTRMDYDLKHPPKEFWDNLVEKY